MIHTRRSIRCVPGLFLLAAYPGSNGFTQEPPTDHRAGAEPAPELVLQLGHRGEIRALAMAPDGRTIATGGDDKSVKLWDAGTGELQRTLIGHTAPVDYLSFSADGRSLASVDGRDYSSASTSSAKFWDVPTGRLLRSVDALRGGDFDMMSGYALSPDWKFVARQHWLMHSGAAQPETVITLQDAQTGKLLRTVPLHGRGVGLGFSPDSRILLYVLQPAGEEGFGIALGLVELPNGEPHTISVSGHLGSYGFSPDGKTVAASVVEFAGDKPSTSVKLWDARSGALLHTLPFFDKQDAPIGLAFAPDGKILATAYWSRQKQSAAGLCLWAVPGAKLLRTIATEGPITSLFFSPDGKDLLTGNYSQVRIWDVTSGRVLQTLAGPAAAHRIALSPQTNRLATAGAILARAARAPIAALSLWDTTTGKLQWMATGREMLYHAGWATLMDDSHTVLLQTNRGPLELWDVRMGRLQRVISGNRDQGWPIALSPDGRTLVKIGNKGWDVYDTSTNQVRFTLPVPVGGGFVVPTDHYFSPDSRWFVVIFQSDVGGEGHFALFDMRTGEVLPGFKGQHSSITSIAFSPHDQTLATASEDGSVNLWDMASRELIGRLLGHKSRVTAVAWSTDGKVIASGAEDGALRLWDPQTQQLMVKWAGQRYRISSVAFSPDSATLASGGEDQTIKLWDTNTQRLKSSLTGHSETIASLLFASDSKTLISADRDNVLKVWNSDKGRLLATMQLLPTAPPWVRQTSADQPTTDPPDWIAFTPDSHYDGSPGVIPFIRLRIGNQLWPASKYETVLHRPEQVQQSLRDEQ